MQPKQGRAQQSGMLRERDPDRFYCPFPNCTRSFAELWRLKVHYRAPPDARGSGKERGHGCELQFCPKCSKELKAGKHHVGCFAGKAGARQAAKRVKVNFCSERCRKVSEACAASVPERNTYGTCIAWLGLLQFFWICESIRA